MINRLLNSTKSPSNESALQDELRECRSKLEAIGRSQAVIEFEMDGTIIHANDNFTGALGYQLNEIVGQHHRMFVDSVERESSEYTRFWETLNRGQFHEGEFRRIRKDGSDIWIQAMYYPITDQQGRPTKVVKFASDITERVLIRNQAQEAQAAVTDSIEQMVATIAEIAGHANQTAKQATTTKQAVEKTETTVSMLGDSSREIEKVVDLIRNLADQTNLLALNATIESARAGEAGKGFAVVAHEVKELAKQTAAATKSIDTSVTNIQDLISDSVESTALVSENISSVTASMTQVAAAVEEQSATMHCLNESASGLRY